MKSLRASLVAQVYGLAVTVVSQLALIPVLIGSWGLQRYGEWTVLNAWASVALFLDFGYVNTAKNTICVHAEEGNDSDSVLLYRSVFAALIAMTTIFALVYSLAWAFGAVAWSANGHGVDAITWGCALGLLFGYVISNHYLGLLCGAIRARLGAASETSLSASIRLGEAMILALVATQTSNLGFAALSYLGGRVVLLALVYAYFTSKFPEFKLTLINASLTKLRRLRGPALGNWGSAMAQLVLIHAPVAVLGSVRGAAEAGLFAAARGIARAGVALANVVSFAFAPEFTKLRAQNRMAQYFSLAKIQIVVLCGATAIYASVMIGASSMVFQLMTRGKVTHGPEFFPLLVLGVSLELLWTGVVTPLMAINKVRGYAPVLVSTTCVCVLASYPLARTFGGNGAAFAVVVAHGATLVSASFAWLRFKSTAENRVRTR